MNGTNLTGFWDCPGGQRSVVAQAEIKETTERFPPLLFPEPSKTSLKLAPFGSAIYSALRSRGSRDCVVGVRPCELTLRLVRKVQDTVHGGAAGSNFLGQSRHGHFLFLHGLFDLPGEDFLFRTGDDLLIDTFFLEKVLKAAQKGRRRRGLRSNFDTRDW